MNTVAQLMLVKFLIVYRGWPYLKISGLSPVQLHPDWSLWLLILLLLLFVLDPESAQLDSVHVHQSLSYDHDGQMLRQLNNGHFFSAFSSWVHRVTVRSKKYIYIYIIYSGQKIIPRFCCFFAHSISWDWKSSGYFLFLCPPFYLPCTTYSSYLLYLYIFLDSGKYCGCVIWNLFNINISLHCYKDINSY